MKFVSANYRCAEVLQIIFVALVSLIGPFVFLAHKGLATVLLPILTITTLWIAHRLGQTRWRALFSKMAPLWILAGVALASTLWSISPADSLSRALRFILECALGGLLLLHLRAVPEEWIARALRGLMFGLAICQVMVLVDWTTGFSFAAWISDNKFGTGPATYYSWGAVFTVILLPATALIAQQMGGTRFAAIVMLPALLIVVLLSNWGAKLALFVAVLTLLILYFKPKLVYFIAVAAALVLAFFPVLTPVNLDSAAVCVFKERKLSAIHRLVIYNYVDDLITKRPYLGYGMKSLRHLAPEVHPAVQVCVDRNEPPLTLSPLAMHPHNLPLQLRLELGLPGILAGLLLLLHLFVVVKRQVWSRRSMAAAGAGFSAWYADALVGFGIWQGWLIAALFLSVAIYGWLLGQRPAPSDQ